MATEYVILVQDVPDGRWSELGRTSQRSATAAIRQAIEGPTGSAPKDGRFVAVPARSWQPVTVKTETKTALKFS